MSGGGQGGGMGLPGGGANQPNAANAGQYQRIGNL
jgi:hypothetical protein